MRFALISLGSKSSRMVFEAAKSYFKVCDDIDIRKVEVHTSPNELVVAYDGKVLEPYDCVYVRGSYKYLLLQRSISAALSNKAYLPLAPESFTLCHNKFLTSLELQKHNLRQPTTYLTSNTGSAKKLIEQVNYPIIIKIPSGTHGKGVIFADSLASAKSMLDTMEVFNEPYIIQEYIDTNATDIRAIVIGNKVAAAMRRRATADELRANIHLGGVGEPYTPDYDTEQLAIKSAQAVMADICAIDILEGARPMVLEVNLSPGLEGINAAVKRNVAEDIAKYLYERTVEFKKQKSSSEYNKIIKDELEIEKEIITNLNVRGGVIKLPGLITQLTGFDSGKEVKMTAKKGSLIIERK